MLYIGKEGIVWRRIVISREAKRNDVVIDEKTEIDGDNVEEEKCFFFFQFCVSVNMKGEIHTYKR